MNYTKLEQETIINYNQEEDVASCYTHDKALIRKLDKLCEKSSIINVTKRTEDYSEYSFPKKWVKIKIPRQLTEEQRQVAAERAKLVFGKNRADKSNGDGEDSPG